MRVKRIILKGLGSNESNYHESEPLKTLCHLIFTRTVRDGHYHPHFTHEQGLKEAYTELSSSEASELEFENQV